MDTADIIFIVGAIIGAIGLLLVVSSILLVPIWATLIFAGKIERGGARSQRLGAMLAAMLSGSILLSALGLAALFISTPII